MENNKDQKSFKIVNKTKEGLTIILYGNKVTVTWEEFKADYVMEKDRMSCHFNKKAQEKLGRAEDLLSQGVIAAMAVNSPRAETDPQWKATNLSVLGKVSEELSKSMGLTIQEVADLIQQRINILNPRIASPKKKKEKRAKVEKKREEKEQVSTPKSKTTVTLGDLPAMQELKKKYGL